MILLVAPPFAMPDKPYIALPTLAAHLRHRGLAVRLWDANLTCFRQLMAPAALTPALEASASRLRAYDAQPRLEAAQLADYAALARAVGGDEPSGGPAIRDLFADPDLGNRQRLGLFGAYLALVTAPGARERLSMAPNTGYLRYHGPASPFASAGLIAHARAPRSLTRDTCRQDLTARLAAAPPSLVGFSVAFPDQILPALTLAAMIKEHAPDLPVVLGGPFVTIHMARCTNPELFSLVDYLALGDGEELLAGLYAHVRSAGRGAPKARHLPGLVFRDTDGVVRTGDPRVFPLAGARAPDYGLLPLDDYLVPRHSAAVLFRLSRGCYWARCAFCNSCSPVIQAYDRPDPAVVYDHLLQTLSQTRCRVVHFTDDAADPDLLQYVAARLIREKQDVTWTVNVRVDRRLTLETLLLLRRAGCFALYLGIESANDRVLKAMRKGTGGGLIRQVLANIAWAGISANIYMIVGFPTETEAEARGSFDQVRGWLDQGLVRRVVYNLLAISPQSPINLAPASYGVTAVERGADQDLEPPAERFACRTGMTRETARRLFAEFSAALQGRPPSGPPSAPTAWPAWARYPAEDIQHRLAAAGLHRQPATTGNPGIPG
jgi:hypothetical protein